MRFGSVCSGIEAASVAWHPLGWRAAWLAEIEPFPSAVLAHHYPDVPNHGDMTRLPVRILTGEVEAPDIFCGGTPCQAFSVAGLRQSLDDARGNLSLTFCEIADAIDHVRGLRGQPSAIIFWENVPGVLSTKDNAFGCFLAGLAGEDEPLVPPGGKWANSGCVYGPQRAVAWRTLDAQYFGVAQRRRRVFVVASARDGFDPAAVLFEWDGVRRDSAPSREAGKTVAGCLTGGATAGGHGRALSADGAAAGYVQPVIAMAHGQGGAEIGFDRGPTLTCNHEAPIALYPVAFDTTQITSAANRSNPQPGDACHPLAAGAHAPAIAFPANLSGTQHASTENLAPAMGAKNPTAVATAYTPKLHNTASNNAGKIFEERTTALDANSPPPALLTSMQVRRLTPVECERLQGFPTASEKVIIEVCLDQQNQGVRAALKCLRWQNSALPADASWSTQLANTAGQGSSTLQAGREPLAALHVRMHSVDELLEIRSLGKLIWSANGVAASNRCLPPMLTEDTVQELARLLREVARTARSGEVESHHSIRLSFPALSGATSAEKFGRATAGSVSDATNGQSSDTFTTSDLGQTTTCSDSTAATLCCSVLRAIAGCIPSETLPGIFSIELTVETPYTAIPWRKKPASDCPDGPRYKALGNSWAVPVVRWIGGSAREYPMLCAECCDLLPIMSYTVSGARAD